jgi:hypothetical protein
MATWSLYNQTPPSKRPLWAGILFRRREELEQERTEKTEQTKGFISVSSVLSCLTPARVATGAPRPAVAASPAVLDSLFNRTVA